MPENNDKNNQNGDLNLTKKDLADMIAAAVSSAIAASKKPSELEQRKIDAEEKQIKADQENRQKTAKSVLEGIEGKKWMQKNCSHEHPRGDSHCIWIQERVGPGYLICQKNQCIIRPGVASPNYKGNVIYDNQLFNRIFQKLQSSGGDITG